MAFEDDVRAALDRTAGALRSHIDTELRRFTDGIAAAAAAEQASAAARAAAMVDAAVADVRQEMEAQLREAQAHVEQMDLQRQQAESQRDEAQAQRADAEAEREQAEAHRRDAELQLGQLEQQHRHVEAQIVQIRTSAQQQVEDVRGSLDTQIAELKRSLADVRRGAQAETDRAVEDAVERARGGAHQEHLAQGARLVDAVRTLDEAQSLGELLDCLAACAAKEVGRAAVLLVKGSRVAGWQFIGFGPDAAEPASVQLAADAAGIVGAVVRTGVSASWPSISAGDAGGTEATLPPFAGDTHSSFALALPILVGGGVVAVLYADAAAGHVPSSASRSSVGLEILARHASRALEAMTMRQVVGVSAPAFRRDTSGPVSPDVTSSGQDTRASRLLG